MTATKQSSYTFLLVCRGSETPWLLALQHVLSALGTIDIVPEEQAVEASTQSHYDAVLVDAGAVQDAALLVSRLRKKRADLRVAVFTSSPTWQRAREALQAGAADYIRTSLEEKEIRSVIKSVLELPPPSANQ
jgi:DNA-binding NarL/FixJ family response regulator